MRIEYTGRHVEVPAEIRKLSDRKLRKLSKVLHGITDVHVILGQDRHRQTVEVTVHSPHLDLAAKEQSTDFAASLTAVMDKLIRQAERHTAKWRVRKGGTSPRVKAAGGGLPSLAPAREEAPRVIRTRRFAVKPMTVEEAALEMGASADGVVVFRDAATERVNVLYRRRDGNLGLIEAEA